MKYSQADGKRFIEFVKSVIASKFSRVKSVDLSDYADKRGVFVTLKIDGDLRGCIGYPYPVLPLNVALEKAASSAAFADPRFSPVSSDELPSLSYEVSILTLPEEIIADDRNDFPSMIKIGRDGLIVEFNGRSGLLLPVVAVEWGFDARTFLEQVCIKAGLPKNSWIMKGCKVYSFEAQVFSD